MSATLAVFLRQSSPCDMTAMSNRSEWSEVKVDQTTQSFARATLPHNFDYRWRTWIVILPVSTSNETLAQRFREQLKKPLPDAVVAVVILEGDVSNIKTQEKQTTLYNLQVLRSMFCIIPLISKSKRLGAFRKPLGLPHDGFSPEVGRRRASRARRPYSNNLPLATPFLGFRH
ncbi:hypothetical protein EVAR_29440_1 [Eumeta japonica]|uniref:Uncharacterized protein n=1 Tax=Eumeta variegata TaxID=151549 RepID=A0A4C1VW91_EUMVA|nr:hypothetical protein EVAR_29440_1 [Eumeta japonica]